jgi:hypothetical protein
MVSNHISNIIPNRAAHIFIPIPLSYKYSKKIK